MILVAANCAFAQKLVLYGQKIALKSYQGKYLVAAGAKTFANRSVASTWEEFEIARPGSPYYRNRPVKFGDTVSIRTHTRRYLTSLPNGILVGNRSKVGPWEKFRIIDPKNHNSRETIKNLDKVSFRTFQNKYLGSNDDGGTAADRKYAYGWENWTIETAIFNINLIKGLGNKCLEINKTNSKVQLADCNGNEYQRWSKVLLNVKNDVEQFTIVGWDNQCLSTRGKAGEQLELITCFSDSGGQTWTKPIVGTFGKFFIKSSLNGSFCLNVSESKTDNGTPIRLQRCEASDSQKWEWVTKIIKR